MSDRHLAEIARTTLPGRASHVGDARRFVSGVLGGSWPRLDDVLVLTSELASNAVKHSASGDGGQLAVIVAMCESGCCTRVQVDDQGGASEPRLHPSEDHEVTMTGGRGLRIVDVLADAWGVDGDELGRSVWFEITGNTEIAEFPT